MPSKIRQLLDQGPIAMLASALFFALMGAMVKSLGQDIPLFQVTFFRAMVSALLLGCVMWRRGIPLKGKNQKLLLIRALSGFTAMALNFYALARMGLGDASVLNQSSPVFVLLFSWIFLGERFYRSLLFLTLVSFLGIVLILRPTGHVFNMAGLAGVGGAVFAAAAYVAIRQLHQTDSFWTMAFYFMALAALLSFPLMLLTWKTPNLTQLSLLLGSGVFGTLGQLLMTLAYKNEEASWVAPFSYAGALFSFCLGMYFFQETPDLHTLAGAGLTIGGGILLMVLRRRIQPPLARELPVPDGEVLEGLS
ncbi:MAG: DMT family transporter [Deltaproteobacteria bacterium]|nr:DMT family transporter [Deltaproteobacteria bacterium]